MTKLDIPEGIIAILTSQIEKNNKAIGDLHALVELQGELLQTISSSLTSSYADTPQSDLALKTYNLLKEHVERGLEADARVPFMGLATEPPAPVEPPKPKRVVVDRSSLVATATALIRHAKRPLPGPELYELMPSVLVQDLDVKKFGSVLSWSGKFTRTKDGWEAEPRVPGKTKGHKGPLGSRQSMAAPPKSAVVNGFDFEAGRSRSAR